MPQTTRSYDWFFRVTMPHVAFMALWREKAIVFQVQGQRVLIVGHVGDKTEKEHVHVLYTEAASESDPHGDYSIQQQTINTRIKKAFGVAKSDYSSKVWDGGMDAGAGSYMFHDTNAVILFNRGFTDEQIKHFQDCNALVRQVVLEKKSKASGRCVDRLLAEIKENGKLLTRREILYKLLKDIRDDNMYECGDYVIRKYVEEIYSKQLAEEQWERYAQLRIEHIMNEGDVELQEITFPMY